MPITDNDRMNIMAQIHSMGPSNAETRYKSEFDKLGLHRSSLDLKMDVGFLPKREFELSVEFIVVYEALRDDLGWWKRTKRRIQLVKEHT